MNVKPVPPEQLEEVWPAVSGWLEKACRYTAGEETPEGLKEKCGKPGHVLVVIEDPAPVGACVFQRDADWLHVVSLGGSNIVSNIAELVDWWARIAAATGCIGLSLRGRKGWDKVFYPFGFRRNGEYLEVKL